MSNKLNRSYRKIQKVFDKMYEKQIKVNNKNKNISLRTKEQYVARVKTFLNEVNRECGVSDLSKVKQEHFDQIIEKQIKNFRDGKTSEASNIKSTLAALNYFNIGVQETNVYSNKKKFSIGNIEKARNVLKEEKVFRRSSYSNVLKANPGEASSVLNRVSKLGYDTKIRDISKSVGYLSMKSGGRVTGILRLKKRDFKRNKYGGEITFKNDKGGLTRTVKVDGETIDYLEHISSKLNPEDDLFEARKKNGDLKSKEQMRQQVSKMVSNASDPFHKVETVTETDKNGNKIEKKVIKKFTTHSFRKAFALERTKDYYLMLKDQKSINKVLNQKFKENPKMKEKYERQLERINKKRNKPRKMRREELAIFLTSVDLGHFRTDVITMYYCNFNDVKQYYNI